VRVAVLNAPRRLDIADLPVPEPAAGEVRLRVALALDDLVTHRLALDQVDDAFAVAVEKPAGFVKASIIIEQ
jgi:hypothetical protein